MCVCVCVCVCMYVYIYILICSCTPLMCICERVWYDAPDAHTHTSRACADDTALHGICASATLSLHKAKSMKLAQVMHS